jgi:uncharacterized protein YfaS (alpha-2-macroglobulin family)
MNTFRTALLVLVPVLMALSCSKSTRPRSSEEQQQLAVFVQSYTSGIISAESDFVVKLREPLRPAGTSPQLFSISPSVNGNQLWLDEYTVVYRPEKRLPQDREFEVTFALGKLVETPDALNRVVFTARTIRQEMAVKVVGLQAEGDSLSVTGEISTADAESLDRISSVLKAETDAFKPVFTLERTSPRQFLFRLNGVVRKDEGYEFTLLYDGTAIGAPARGSEQVYIPGKNEFAVETVERTQIPAEAVEIVFSDVLDKNQNFNGLIRFSGEEVTNPVVKGNRIVFYPGANLSGNHTVSVEPGIKSVLGRVLKQPFEKELVYSVLKPAVRFAGKGVIMPTGAQMTLPFEAVNLKEVIVSVTRIYEMNMIQFLQDNNLDGSNRLEHVGNEIVNQTVTLSSLGEVNRGQWGQYALDLSKFVEAEPGAVYRVQLRFMKQHALYDCSAFASLTAEQRKIEYDGYSDAFGYEATECTYDNPWVADEEYGTSNYYPTGFRWNLQEDPCHVSYYTPDRWVSRNLLASDLGVTAKTGNDKSVVVHVRDLKTTAEKPGVKVDVYDFARQLLASGVTTSDGSVKFSGVKDPSFVIASEGKQRGYVKLNQWNALSVSAFDVEGQDTPNGVKGKFYTERGVWRPGDSLYAVFVLDDRQNPLPKPYPVAFELLNPRGLPVQKLVRAQSMNGFYSVRLATSADAPTGNWTLKAVAGGQKFLHTLRIETIKPNRLRLRFTTLDFVTSNGALTAKMESSWLHGAPARNLRAKVNLGLWPAPATFKGFEKFVFDDPYKQIAFEPKDVLDGKLSETGTASFTEVLENLNNAAGFLKVRLNSRVFEDSGDFSVFQDDEIIKPYPFFYGIMSPEGDRFGQLETGKPHVFEIAAVDKNGVPQAGKVVEITFYKLEWRWWWDKNNDNVSNYHFSQSRNEKLKKTVTTDANGKAKLTVTLNNEDWGRYFVRVGAVNAHTSGKVVYFDWPGWAGRSREGADAATRLSFALEKETYKTGETVNLTIPAGGSGSMLISIENNSGVLRHDWVPVKDGEVKFSFKTGPEMAPNAYIHATLVQPFGQQKNDAPIRLYGIMPLMVEDPQSRLAPVISMSDELKPETKTTVKVSEKAGRAMTYTLALVDEGLLDLTRFKTPDLWPHFYAKSALGVRSFDMYEHVAGAFSGTLSRIITIGGDDALNKKESSVIRFKPMVRYYGPYVLAGNKTASHEVDIPAYIGSVRVMVVAGQDGAYGHAQKTVAVKNPLMLLTTMPRALGINEKLSIPVSVFSMDKTMRDVQVKLELSEHFIAAGPLQQTVTFEGEGETMVYFDVETTGKPGAAKVTASATGKNEKASETIDIDIKNANPYVSKVVTAEIKPGGNATLTIPVAGVAGTNSSSLELSTLPSVNMQGRLDELLGFPHGCLEQTVSKAFPQLHLAAFTTLSPDQKTSVSGNIREALIRLTTFQTGDGAFAYWPGQTVSSDYASVYATHFLVEAKAAGYSIPGQMLELARQALRKTAQNWSYARRPYDALTQAYRLYVLAMAGVSENGAMNRLREKTDLDAETRWRLAGAYMLAGQPEAAQSLLKNAVFTSRNSREFGNTFGSELRDRAMILEVQALRGDLTDGLANYRTIASALASDRWISTQETAFSLLALARFSAKAGSDPLACSISVNGKPLALPSGKHRSLVLPLENAIAEAGGTIQISSTGKSMLFASINTKGQPPVEPRGASASNIELAVVYYSKGEDQPDPDNLRQGDDVIVEVTVKNPGKRGDYEELALSAVFPTGWEVLNPRLVHDGFTRPADVPEYQDQRDNRINTYFDLPAGKEKVFRFLVTATHRGRFFFSPVSVSAMYDGSVTAQSDSRWIEVKPFR